MKDWISKKNYHNISKNIKPNWGLNSIFSEFSYYGAGLSPKT